VLLAHFATLRMGQAAVDLGSGTGVLAFLLVSRGAKQVTGVEIDPQMADMAIRSVLLNGLGEQIKIINGDLRSLRGRLPAGESELVISNPPYYPVGGGYISPNSGVARACHELTANLADVVAAAKYLVKYRGRFAMVHLPERMAEILKVMSDQGIEPKRLQLVHPSINKKPNILLVEGIRGGRPGLDVLPPLIVYNADGSYSDEIMAYYEKKKDV
jgi:tRNA1(Val) A37 N6-methylase TrmN6